MTEKATSAAEVTGAREGLAITSRYTSFVNYMYPMAINWPGKQRVFRERFIGLMLDQVKLFYEAAKSGQASRLYLADAGLATLRWDLRFATNPARKLLSRLTNVFPGFLYGGAQNCFIRNKLVRLCHLPSGFPSSASGTDFYYVVSGQLGMSIALASSIVSGVLKRIVDVFFDGSVFQIRSVIVERISIKVARNQSSWLDAVPTLKDKSMSRNKLGNSILCDAEFFVFWCVFWLDDKLRNLHPMARSFHRPSAAHTFNS